MPNYVADTVLDIDTRMLQEAGITHIVFDLDRTLVGYGSNSLLPSYQQFIATLRNEGFTVLLGSNARRDIADILSILDVRAITPQGVSFKPFQSFYRRIVVEAGTKPRHIVMVGDHILNDVVGANRAGFCTILVRGLRDKTSLLYGGYIRYALRHAAR